MNNQLIEAEEVALSLEAKLEIENDKDITSVDVTHPGNPTDQPPPQNLNRMRSFDADPSPLVVETPNLKLFMPPTEPERWRYAACDGRDFLPKPKEPTDRIRDGVSAPDSSKEYSSTLLQRDETVVHHLDYDPWSPAYEGGFDDHGEILDYEYSAPQGKYDPQDRLDYFPVAPSQQIPLTPGRISSRHRSRSRACDIAYVDSNGNCFRRGSPNGDDESDLHDQSKTSFQRRSVLHHMRSCELLPRTYRTQASSDSEMDDHEYERLDSLANQIRLIRLEPQNSTVTTASLFVASLDDAPEYEALSYTWGNSQKSSLIHLDKVPFQVTQNLAAALEKLQGTESRILWIDAICINQKDHYERSDQVAKMRTIYAQASAVLVWLGDHSQHSTLAFSLLDEMDTKLNDKLLFETFLNSADKIDALQGLSKILSREYWWRIWVIQEVHFAAKVTIHCGNSRISWEKMIRIQEKLSAEFSGILHQLSTLCPPLRDFSTAVQFRGPSSLILARSNPSAPKSTETVPGLFEALLMHRLKHSTDPRDKIYALVGLTTARSDPGFQIDYSHSVRKVYIDTAAYILKNSQTLDFLCAKTKGDEFPQGLPSYCPNWASTGANCPIPFRRATRTGIYSASQTRTPKAKIDTHTGVLSAEGIRVRTVKNISPPCRMQNIIDTQNALQTLHIWFQFVNVEFGTSVETYRRFVTLALGDTNEEKENTSLIEYLVKYRELIDYWVTPPPPPKEIEHVSQVLAQTSFQRRLFVTDEGEFGLTEKGVQEGDKICILFGCSLPVVLRRDGEEMESGHEFVGDALLQGWMFGRGIEELEKGIYCEETFILGG